MKGMFSITKRLFANSKVSILITAVVMLCATTSGDSAIALSNGNYSWLLSLISPFLFVYYDYKKLMHLGAGKKDYFTGTLLAYGLFALLISLVNTGIHLLIDPLNQTQTVINMMDLCGWTANGPVIAFLQQTLFLLLSMIFLHVLLSMQPYWYGWLTDGFLVAIICIFTPIAPLRHILAGFFKIIMFNDNAMFHMGVCLMLCAGLSWVGLTVLKKITL